MQLQTRCELVLTNVQEESCSLRFTKTLTVFYFEIALENLQHTLVGSKHTIYSSTIKHLKSPLLQYLPLAHHE